MWAPLHDVGFHYQKYFLEKCKTERHSANQVNLSFQLHTLLKVVVYKFAACCSLEKCINDFNLLNVACTIANSVIIYSSFILDSRGIVW